MSKINLKLISSITKLHNKEFKQLYLALIEITERYIPSFDCMMLKTVFGLMQRQVEKVKLLDVKLNVPSDSVKQRNVVHGYIKNEVRRMRILLKSNKLSNIPSEIVNANYAFPKLDKLMRLQKVSSVGATSVTIDFIRDTIETDAKLANALVEMNMMRNVEMLYKWQEEFNELNDEQIVGKLTAPAIDKKAIRNNAARTLKHLFNIIEMEYADTKDEGWGEMAEEIRLMVHPME